MIAAQRRAKILEHLRQHGGDSISVLAEMIDVSPSTIRRDLDYLVERGYISRSHGGAIVNAVLPTTFEPEQELGAHVARSAKVGIGLRAAGLIEPGQSVIFDSSSTVLEAARAVVDRGIRITACTNDISTAAMLARSEALQLIVLGGSRRPESLTLLGEPGLTFLRQIKVDVALIGIHSLYGGALSETSLEAAAMKRQMIASALNVIVVADSSKFRHPAFSEVAQIQPSYTIVTDTGLLASDRDLLNERGARLIECEPTE